MKHDLFADSEDLVEQMWGREIDKRFSFYAVFWSEFIGKNGSGRKPDQRSRGYGLRFPAAVVREKQEFILDHYRRICQTHYSLFCHLAGAHHELAKLRKNLPRNPKQSFVYFETLGNLYYRMSSSIEMLQLLWGWLYELKNEAAYKPKSFTKSVQKQFQKDLESYHLTRSYKELLRQIVSFEKAFCRLQRFATVTRGNRVYAPKVCKKRYPFLVKENSHEWVECRQKATEDLEALEIFANCLQVEYLKGLKAWLEHRSISIKYVKANRTGSMENTELEAGVEKVPSSKAVQVEPSPEDEIKDLQAPDSQAV